jgi:tetratricopeptide (TPR) repeat protein
MGEYGNSVVVVLVYAFLKYAFEEWKANRKAEESTEQGRCKIVLSSEEQYLLGKYHLSEKAYDRALDFFNNAISIEPSFTLYLLRGETYLNLKRFTAAIEDYTVALKKSNIEAKIYLNRGIAYYEIEAFEHAKKDWEKASKLGCESSGFYLAIFNDKTIKDHFYRSAELPFESDAKRWN